MAGRSTSSAVITFGMVRVPVSLHGSVKERKVSFNTLHRQCGQRTKSWTVCPECQPSPVDGGPARLALPRGATVKGYDTGEGFALLEEDDFAKLPLRSAKAMEVSAFVPAQSIPREMVEKVYWLTHDARAQTPPKAFHLLRSVLEKTGQAAIAKSSRSGKEQLVAIVPDGPRMALVYLHWWDEMVPAPVQIDEVEVTEDEVNLAGQLVASMSKPFSAVANVKDEYRKAVEEMITQKALHPDHEYSPPELEEPEEEEDLLAALTASVAAA